MTIKALADHVVSQIAAGEVIERPASVIKELTENALDAGATSITIEVEGGGRNLMRISDNGSGIRMDEVELAFARHATSKLENADDLFSIATLGFRGEALASISSVSRLSCVSRHRDEDMGTQIKMEGGTLLQRRSIGAPAGTVISVENLFFNVPARLKFLKSDSAERSHISRIVSRYAMAYPHVRFRLEHDNRTVFQTTGSGNLQDVLVSVYNADTAKQMLPVKQPDERVEEHTTRVSGYISAPSLNRGNNREITFFVNGRWVQDRKLQAAVTQAYHTMLMVQRYPYVVLMIDVPPDEVDVNVHPTKAEVRFRFADRVFSAINRSLRNTLVEAAPVPEFIEPRGWSTGENRQISSPATWERKTAPAPDVLDWGLNLPTQPAQPVAPPPSQTGIGLGTPTQTEMPVGAPEPQQEMATPEMPLLRVIGQIGASYIVAEGPDGLYLIDQHAAHERILYEAFMAEHARSKIASQGLLQPAAVDVPVEAVSLINDNLDVMNGIGFEVEPFGGNTFLVRSMPAVLGQMNPEKALRVVIEDFECDETPFQNEFEKKIIARVCKRASVKAGQVLSGVEQKEMVRQLEQCDSPRTCPHGRPTMIHLSVDLLEKQFQRK